MSEWRPIKTAPKDGTEIIGCCQAIEDGQEVYYGAWTIAWCKNPAHWRASWDKTPVIEFMSEQFGEEYKSPDCQPTHWMPMPGAPK